MRETLRLLILAWAAALVCGCHRKHGDSDPAGDSTAPVAGTVSDGLGIDVDWQASTSVISANWTGFSDPESGISDYEWAVGTTAGAEDFAMAVTLQPNGKIVVGGDNNTIVVLRWQ